MLLTTLSNILSEDWYYKRKIAGHDNSIFSNMAINKPLALNEKGSILIVLGEIIFILSFSPGF